MVVFANDKTRYSHLWRVKDILWMVKGIFHHIPQVSSAFAVECERVKDKSMDSGMPSDFFTSVVSLLPPPHIVTKLMFWLVRIFTLPINGSLTSKQKQQTYNLINIHLHFFHYGGKSTKIFCKYKIIFLKCIFPYRKILQTSWWSPEDITVTVYKN